MRRIDLINKISSNNVVQSVKSMQVLDEQSKEKRVKKRKSRFRIGEHEEPEIQAAIDKGLAVNILYDSNC
jgi:hypothetical protein